MIRVPTDENPVFWLRCALLVIATYAFIRAIRYGFGGEQLPMALNIVSSVIPIQVWAIAWTLAGLAAIACVPRALPAGSAGVIILGIGFAVGYTVSWLSSFETGDPISHSDYVGANNYWTVPLLLVCGYFGFMRAMKKPAPPTETP